MNAKPEWLELEAAYLSGQMSAGQIERHMYQDREFAAWLQERTRQRQDEDR
jgi:hypothetical protein